MRELITINNVRGYLDENGIAQLNLEDMARGLGFTRIATSGNEVIRWETVRRYIEDLGVPTSWHDGNTQQIGKEGLPEFVSESVVYKLCFKANNDTARKFQDLVADEILPSIRKHGMYATPQALEAMLNDPDTMIKTLQALKAEREKSAALQLEVRAKEQIIEEQKPMVLFGSALRSSETSILIGEFAKILRQSGVNIGQNRLFEWLREKKYLCKEGERYNKPTEYSARLGLLEYKATVISRSNGTYTKYTPKLTAKGQEYFISMFQKKVKPREIQQTLQYSLLTTEA